jgi:hypothetical protein
MKQNNTPFIFIIVILVIILLGMIVYTVLGQTNRTSPITTALPTLTELPMPTTANIALPKESPTVTQAQASPTATVKPLPTRAPNPDGNTFTSQTMGISFYYANKTPADSTGTVKTSESGTKAYVYITSGNPESGQSIERFEKSPTDSLSQAITKKFLSGIPVADCFVKINPTKPSPTVTKATIGYPIPTNADLPNWEYGEKCPAKYKESNGMAYFFEDSTYPNRFYYVSIGQYGIPAYNSKESPMWQDTIVVF